MAAALAPVEGNPVEGRTVEVRVPATSANLGPGFDTLGLALSVYDELEAMAAWLGVRLAIDERRSPAGPDAAR